MQLPRIGLPRVDVKPGERYATSGAVEIKTLLGSCIAACLYDPISKVAGLNHFLLAAPRYARSMPFTTTDAGRYGIHAMELLIADMQKLGAKRSNLHAKIFGGASVLEIGIEDKFLCVSEVNQRFIHEYLDTENIPTVSEDVGGTLGRVIHFHTDSYKVFRRFIRKVETMTVEKVEHDFWKAEVAEPKAGDGGVLLF